ncbi:helix-turn-helix transcriptional regulator [Streptomyces sp. ZAF1911]|uniref:helix-turn-helix domain-containing protein n=1 Tax=Streptomyces sp. ZAF1911 TaxID=2944129 RepID=UPI00237B5838|nr:helix-turn-helix transcriptional regulator [Streptomyces sp. ZAF1911]MDD9377876.1 helix-turn-helix transcriptional regulator [Streptomyces sp. ZAF1911]
MTQNDWQGRLTQHVADAVRHYRKDRGLSAQALADACGKLGYPVPRTSIANLENGRRSGVELAELLVLAKALEIPPIMLMLPVGMAGSVEVVPGDELPIWDAIAWISGETLLGSEPNPGTANEIIYELRIHAQAVNQVQKAIQLAEETQQYGLYRNQRLNGRSMLEAIQNYAKESVVDLRDYRRKLRARGIEPPALAEDLQFLDDVQ